MSLEQYGNLISNKLTVMANGHDEVALNVMILLTVLIAAFGILTSGRKNGK